MSLYDLLPPNATALERDLSRAVSFLPKLETGPPTIRTAKRRNIPASVLPWLVYEYGLGEISPYIQDLEELIAEGVEWQRIRGTPASILQAMGWLGLQAVVDESEAGSYKWSEFQIGLEAAVPDQTVRDVVRLAEISSPVRSRLQRVFAVYDLRRFVLDDSTLSGGAILSDHSGTRPYGPDGVQVSFGIPSAQEIEASASVDFLQLTTLAREIPWGDRWILDHSLMGGGFGTPEPGEHTEAWHVLNHPARRVDEIGQEISFGVARAWIAEPWMDEPWGVAGVVVQSDATL